MPSFNQTGPVGQGPMTGRQMGRCASAEANSENVSLETIENADERTPKNFQSGGFGRGRGRGNRRGGQGAMRGGPMGRFVNAGTSPENVSAETIESENDSAPMNFQGGGFGRARGRGKRRGGQGFGTGKQYRFGGQA